MGFSTTCTMTSTLMKEGMTAIVITKPSAELEIVEKKMEVWDSKVPAYNLSFFTSGIIVMRCFDRLKLEYFSCLEYHGKINKL